MLSVIFCTISFVVLSVNVNLGFLWNDFYFASFSFAILIVIAFLSLPSIKNFLEIRCNLSVGRDYTSW